MGRIKKESQKTLARDINTDDDNFSAEFVSKAVELHNIMNTKHGEKLIECRKCSLDDNPEEIYFDVHAVGSLLASMDDPRAEYNGLEFYHERIKPHLSPT